MSRVAQKAVFAGLAAGILCVSAACHNTKADVEINAANKPRASMATVNDHCPILGWKKVDAGAPTTVYKGRVIGFCCDKCPAKWEKWSEDRKNAFVARQTGK